jgi:hypothetical protein
MRKEKGISSRQIENLTYSKELEIKTDTVFWSKNVVSENNKYVGQLAEYLNIILVQIEL